VLKQPVLKQGLHIDPLDPATPPPDPVSLRPNHRAAFDSPEMELFRQALLLEPGGDARRDVLDDLSSYFGLSHDESLRRCLHWEELSVEEWQAGDRTTAEGLRSFYQSLASWSFDLLWYAYLQTEGYGYPASVIAARYLREHDASTQRHLDFGSGVGVTGQLFAGLGYEAYLADVSTPLLEFAKFRLERRGVSATYVDLNAVTLEAGRYDVITAIDTLVHVPDLTATVTQLHQALRPAGWLFTNFDVRPSSAENAWHLYDDDLRLRWIVQRSGFKLQAVLDGTTLCYQKVDRTGWRHRACAVRDAVLLLNPVRRYGRRVRWPTPAKIRRRVRARQPRQDVAHRVSSLGLGERLRRGERRVRGVPRLMPCEQRGALACGAGGTAAGAGGRIRSRPRCVVADALRAGCADRVRAAAPAA
jgi:SAM-dependent methyltransferase